MLQNLQFILYVGMGLAGCAVQETHSRRSPSSEAQINESEQNTENEVGLDLTQSQCSLDANISKVTASPSGQLYINSPVVLNDVRAQTIDGIPGKWSFAYAFREILELPNPGNDPTKLAVEQAKVMEFLDKFTQTAQVNSFVPPTRNSTRARLLKAWGTTLGTDNMNFLTFDKAPFKLTGIVNRLDIVKKGKTAVTAGEGRFVYGFTDFPQMTVILEYNLPIGASSNKGLANIFAWTAKWRGLKTFLTDTNAAVRGTQPDQTVNAPLAFRDTAGYLRALENVTDLWANRTAQKHAGGTQAAISQIRTNEVLSSPWELREIIRARDPSGVPTLILSTVKNNPDQSFQSGGNGLTAWLEANVVCTNANDRNSCSYNTANGQMPEKITNGSATVNLLGTSAPTNFSWFDRSTNAKHRFLALNTCSGCHTTETGTRFVHTNTISGAPSAFLQADLATRLRNFKNLVCLSAASTGGLDLTDGDNLSGLRVGVSGATH